MLKLFGSDLSSPSNKVRYVLNFLEMDYAYQPLSLRDNEHLTAEFKAMHPAGKIPVIDHDGFVLFESNAICRYLCEVQGAQIYPRDDIYWTAQINQWIDFATIHVGVAVNKIMFNRVFATVVNKPVDEQSLKDGQMFLNRFLPVLNQQLKGKDYILNNEMSLADFVVLSTLDPVEAALIDLSRYDEIVRWRTALKGMDFYKDCYDECGDYTGIIENMKSAGG
jgi:glutathione S-transferase